MTQAKIQENIRKFTRELRKDADLAWLGALWKKFPRAQAYMVGGAVRDRALGRKKEIDYDLVARGVPMKKLERFLASKGTVSLVGRSFGVLKFRPRGYSHGKGEFMDVALPRTEFAVGMTGAYRDFSVQSDPKLPIEKDLSRRDFTINALALDLQTGELVDEWQGLQDLAKGIIRTVGKPEDRFREDYSRMLRALRFSAQLEFEIQRSTWLALKRTMPRINRKSKGERIIPYEVVAKELLKAFDADPALAMDLYDKSSAMQALIPEALDMKGCPQPKPWHTEGDCWQHTRLSLEVLSSARFKRFFPEQTPSIEVVMAAFFHDMGKPPTLQTPKKDKVDRIRFNNHHEVGATLARSISERLRLSSVPGFDYDADNVAWLVRNHLILVMGDVKAMRNTTVAKYFFSERYPSQGLLMVLAADGLATVPANGRPDLSPFNAMRRRIRSIQAMAKKEAALPKPLLRGGEIIATFNLSPGPVIGELLNETQEEQLAGRIKTKEQALSFLKKRLKRKAAA